nr:MAG TPA: hypothetical protein [Bacteriophage sp.]
MKRISQLLGSEKGFAAVMKAFGIILLINSIANPGLAFIAIPCLSIKPFFNHK